MTDDEWQRLADNFNASTLLEAMDCLAAMRHYFTDQEDRHVSPLHDGFGALYHLAHAVIHEGLTHQAPALFSLANNLDSQLTDLMTLLETVQHRVQALLALYPKRLMN